MSAVVYWWLSDEEHVAVDGGFVPNIGDKVTITYGDAQTKLEYMDATVVRVQHNVCSGHHNVDVFVRPVKS